MLASSWSVYLCVIVMHVCDWVSTPQEYGAPPLSQRALCVRTFPPEPACLPKPRCSFVWLAFLLFIPLPFRFFSLQLTRVKALDSERGSERDSVRESGRWTETRQTSALWSEFSLKWGQGNWHITRWGGRKTKALVTVLLSVSWKCFMFDS